MLKRCQLGEFMWPTLCLLRNRDLIDFIRAELAREDDDCRPTEALSAEPRLTLADDVAIKSDSNVGER